MIGTICYICQSEVPPLERVLLETKSGPIVGRYKPERKIAEADVPCNFKVHQHYVNANALLKSSSLRRTSVITSEHPVASIVKGMTFVLIELPSTTRHLEHLNSHERIDLSTVRLDEGWTETFIGVYFYCITSVDEKMTKIRARMLEPAIGEDPATGSAASTLGCFLALKGGIAHMTYIYSIEQGVELGRRSHIYVKVLLDGTGQSVKRVMLSGKAVKVSEGRMVISEGGTDVGAE